MPADDPSTVSLDADDRTAIADLLYAYAWHFDRNEPEAFAELFSDDAVIDHGPQTPTIVGRRNVAGAVAGGLAEIFAATSHHISNVRLSPDGAGGASATAYVYAWHRYRSGAPDGYLWGQYHCRFRRTAQGWRISELVLRVAGMQNFHRAVMHPIGRRPSGASGSGKTGGGPGHGAARSNRTGRRGRTGVHVARKMG